MKKYLFIIFLFLGVAVNALAQKEMSISGTVTDATGEPLVGASVTVKDVAGLGAITNIDGQYKIKAKEYQTLVFSYVGFSTQEVVLKGDKSVINIKLEEDKANALDDVVVTAMGTQKKLTVTGAISNVEMGDLKHYSTSPVTCRVSWLSSHLVSLVRTPLSSGFVVCPRSEQETLPTFSLMVSSATISMISTLRISSRSQY